MAPADASPISPAMAGLKGRCPRCGRGRLFRGFIALAARCDACGFDYAFADAGDGPAVFVSFAALVVVVGLALVVDAAFEPPVWLLILILAALSVALCLALLRPAKGLMIGLQYRNRAEQGRIRP